MRSGIGNSPSDPIYTAQVADPNAAPSASPAGTATSPIYVGDGAGAKADRSLSASTSSQQAAPANANRRRLLIQNQDAAINVFVNLGAAATAGQGSFRIGPGGLLDIEGSNQALNVIAQSGAPIVTIWEF